MPRDGDGRRANLDRSSEGIGDIMQRTDADRLRMKCRVLAELKRRERIRRANMRIDFLVIAFSLLLLYVMRPGCVAMPYLQPPPAIMQDSDGDGAPDIDDIDPFDPRIGRMAPARKQPIPFDPYGKPDA